LNLVDVEVAELGDHEDYSVLLNCLHEDREVTLDIGWHLDVNWALELLITWGGTSNLHEVNLLNRVTSLLLAERENAIFVGGVCGGYWDISEASSVPFENLLLLLLGVVKLHPWVYVLLVRWIQANKVAPLFARVHSIWHDLAVCHLLRPTSWVNDFLPFENFLGGILVGDVDVEYGGLANEGNLGEGHVLPEGDGFRDLSLLKLLLGVQIENLLFSE